MQRHAQVQVADALDVAAVVVHDEQLQASGGSRLGGRKRVAVAGEDHLAARQRAGARVEDAVADRVLAGLRRAEVLRPVAGAGVGRELLLRQPDDLARLDVDLVDVGTGRAAPR